MVGLSDINSHQIGVLIGRLFGVVYFIETSWKFALGGFAETYSGDFVQLRSNHVTLCYLLLREEWQGKGGPKSSLCDIDMYSLLSLH